MTSPTNHQEPTARPPFQAPIPTDSPGHTLIRILSQRPQLRDPFLQRRRGNDDESFLVNVVETPVTIT